jgi:hypothetical protein
LNSFLKEAIMSKWLVMAVLSIGVMSRGSWSFAQKMPEAKAPLPIIRTPSAKIVPMVHIGFDSVCAYCLPAQETGTKRAQPVQPPDDKAADQAPDKNADDLKAMMEARLRLAHEVLKLSQERLKVDVNARWQDFVDASLRVLNADLELSRDKAARVAAHQRHLKVAEDLARFPDAAVRNKTMSELERQLVRYLLIDAKIGLEREKARK